MKYEYITATGKTEIEVDEEFYNLLITMDKEEFNSHRKHDRRRPVSLEDVEYEGEWFEDTADILGDLIIKEDTEQLCTAISHLSLKQQTLIDKVYFRYEKIIDIAREQGVSQSAISQRLATAIKKLKKFL